MAKNTPKQARGESSDNDPTVQAAIEASKRLAAAKGGVAEGKGDDGEGDGGDDPTKKGAKKSGLLEAFRAATSDDNDDGDDNPDLLTDEQKAEALRLKAEADKKKKVSDEDPLKKYEDLEDEIDVGVASPRLGDKVKRFHRIAKSAVADLKKATEQRTALEAEKNKLEGEITTLKEGGAGAGDIEKNPVVVELRKKVAEATELVERVSLEDSPDFKKRFDGQAAAHIADMESALDAIESKEARQIVLGRLMSAINVPPGKDGQAAFMKLASEIARDENIPEFARDELKDNLRAVRKVVNAKFEALTDWKTTKHDVDQEGLRNKTAMADSTKAAFKEVRSKFETGSADRIKKYRENKEVFQYDETVGPELTLIDSEIEKSVRLGVPTPTLLSYVNYGAEAVFLNKQNKALIDYARDQQKKIADLEKALGKKSKQEPGAGGRDSIDRGGDEDVFKPGKGQSAILHTMRQETEK